jgi:hypothetical protein
MDNNYFTNVGSYMQPMTPQEQQGLMPVFQNIGSQQANQNAAMQQGMDLTNQAGMTVKGQQVGAGTDQQKMANALRQNPYINAQTAMNQYGAGNVYGYGGQGVVPTTTTGMD